jgi:hypothetical protein
LPRRRVVRVDENPRGDEHVIGVVVGDGELVLSGLVQDPVDVVVLVDQHHRQVPLAGVGQGQRGPAGQVDDGTRVEGVPVLTDDRLVVQRCRFADVTQLVDPARLVLKSGEHACRLGPREVVDVDLLGSHVSHDASDEALTSSPGRGDPVFIGSAPFHPGRGQGWR